MSSPFKTSLCISTYNCPEALELCLLSALRQSVMPTEIVIGDDGSTEQTKNVIDHFQNKFSIPLIHVWHPDEGFRLAAIRNKSFAASSGDYIIQVDGDLILNKFFVEDHVRFAKQNAFVAGTRSMINQPSTQRLLQQKSILIDSDVDLDKRYNAHRISLLSFLLYHLQKGIRQTKYVLGANMAFWKKDLIKVNGYNEDFEGWGKEDNDLSLRLCNAGVMLHFLRFAAIIYHLHHKGATTASLETNQLMLMKAMKEKQEYVANGMSKYL